MLENTSAVRSGSESRPSADRHGLGKRASRVRSRTSNDPKFLSKQPPNPRAVDRRRRDLVEAFLAALGSAGASDLTQLMVRRAAELTVAAELARAGMLNGTSPSDITGLIKLENAARRAVIALGLKIEKPPARARGLELARLRWAEDAEREQKARATEAGDGR